MAEYINKIVSNNQEYGIKDTRVPDATSSDEGKAVVVDAQGDYVLSTPSAGGTKLYKHSVKFTNGVPNQFLYFFCDRQTPFYSTEQIRDYKGPMIFNGLESFMYGIPADGSSTTKQLDSRPVLGRALNSYFSLDVESIDYSGNPPYKFSIVVTDISDTTNFGKFVSDTVTDTW